MKISEIISAMSTAIIPIVAKGTPESMIFAAGVQPLLSTAIYKSQNKMFHFCKTFCSKITLVNTIQNVILNPI